MERNNSKNSDNQKEQSFLDPQDLLNILNEIQHGGDCFKEQSFGEKLVIFDSEDISGLADREYFINKIDNNQGSNIFNLLEYRQKDLGKDGNCGYRAIALQLYSNENYHNLIRKDVYDYLTLKKDNFVGFNFEYAGNLLDANEYIEKVKQDDCWMVDLELSVLNLIYDTTLLVYQKRNDGTLILLQTYGNINDPNKLFLNLCYVNNNHYLVLYEKNNDNENIFANEKFKKENKKLDINNIKKKTMVKAKKLKLDIKYANDDKIIKYNDIIRYIKNKNKNNRRIYPQEIYNISNK